MEKNIVLRKIMLDLPKTSRTKNSSNWTTKIQTASPKITTTMKLSTNMKICLRKKKNFKMMNQLFTLNIMKTKMISTTITHKWLMIFHPKKEAMLKMKKEKTMNVMVLTTTMLLVQEMPTHKTRRTINILKATSITNKAFMMKFDKAVEVRKTEINKFGSTTMK